VSGTGIEKNICKLFCVKATYRAGEEENSLVTMAQAKSVWIFIICKTHITQKSGCRTNLASSSLYNGNYGYCQARIAVFRNLEYFIKKCVYFTNGKYTDLQEE
jgi:hypothetical protein